MQYDMCLGCFERALSLASGNECAAEVWYNVSMVAMSLGDIGLAYQVLPHIISHANTSQCRSR